MGPEPDLANLAFERSASPILVLDTETDELGHVHLGKVLDCSDTFSVLTGSDTEDMVGKSPADYVHPDDAQILHWELSRLLDPANRPQVRFLHPVWGVVWVALSLAVVDDYLPDKVLVIATLDDVTEIRRVQEELARQATHDSLTGLPNRGVLMSHLTRVLAMLDRKPGAVAALFVDLDGFKDINDNYGHDIGDLMLREVASRIGDAVRRHDVVTRLGGDEFVVVCDALGHQAESAHVAERIRTALERPFELEGRSYTVSGSIGVAQTSDSMTDPEELLRQADLAMYRAKERGHNRVEFFADFLDRRARRRMQAAERLREALDRDGLSMDLQPIVSLADSAIVGFEALARIVLPDGTVWRAADFIETANQTGLTSRIDASMIDLSLRMLAHANTSSWMALNVSCRMLGNMSMAKYLLEHLEEAGVPPQRVVLEITESSLQESSGSVLSSLRELRAAGVRIALDNFGVGPSALNAMRELPIDILKIDASFIRGLGESAIDESLVSAMIGIGRDLGRSVIAKGVERPKQAEFLKMHKCDMAQGYLMGPPSPAKGG